MSNNLGKIRLVYVHPIPNGLMHKELKFQVEFTYSFDIIGTKYPIILLCFY